MFDHEKRDAEVVEFAVRVQVVSGANSAAATLFAESIPPVWRETMLDALARGERMSVLQRGAEKSFTGSIWRLQRATDECKRVAVEPVKPLLLRLLGL